MLRKILGLMVASSFLLLATGVLNNPVSADVNDFTVTNFEADYYLSKNNPHGELDISEKIEVNFSDYNHGILRAIPASYQGHSLKISNISTVKSDGKKWPFETYSQNGNLVLKIGDPNQTVTGPATFIVNYKVTGPISFFDTHDELFWDVNGDGWQQEFVNVTGRLHVPKELASQLLPQQKCYAGKFNEQFENCFIKRETQSDNSVLITSSATDLGPYQTLSFVIAFDKGTFAVYTYKDEISEHIKDILFATLALGILVLAFVNWWQKGRDYKGKGVLIAEYKPPKGVDPLRAGIIQDYNLDSRDITAAIVDLAVRGHITIIEESSKKMLVFSSRKYSLELKNTDTSRLNEYEDKLIQALFEPFTVGSKVDLGSYNAELAKATKKIGEDLTAKLTEEGYYEQNPQKTSYKRAGFYIVLNIIIIVVAFVFSAVIGAFLAIAILLINLVLLSLMPRRSRLGQATNDTLKGLKYYIEVAEKQRIKKLQSAGAVYTKKSHEPKKTVELFEKLLPYAIIFGVEKSWAKQFQDIYAAPPDWYHGNMTTFNTIVLTDHLMSSANAVGSTFAAPSSSGSSGFSGGGSGGGGGGGGGGGW